MNNTTKKLRKEITSIRKVYKKTPAFSLKESILMHTLTLLEDIDFYVHQYTEEEAGGVLAKVEETIKNVLAANNIDNNK